MSKLDALTSLRFFAASAIVIEHSKGLFIPIGLLPDWPLDQGVSFFFVLSGFILVYVYPELPTLASILQFWTARVARIWPAHLFTLLLMLIWLSAHRAIGDDGLRPFIANVLMVHAWVPEMRYYFSYNSVSWTISTELGFYILFPVLVFSFRTTWWLKLISAAGTLFLLIFLCTKLALPIWSNPNESVAPSDVTARGLLYINPLGRLLEFVIGMSVALLCVRLRGLTPGWNIWVWTAIELLVVALVLNNVSQWTWDLVHHAYVSPFPITFEWVVHAGSCLSFALLIFVMAGGAGVFGKLLSLPFFVFLGEISYAMYMLHAVLTKGYLQHFDGAYFVPAWPLFVVFAFVLLFGSAALFFFIERPARRLIRSLSSGKSRPGVSMSV